MMEGEKAAGHRCNRGGDQIRPHFQSQFDVLSFCLFFGGGFLPPPGPAVFVPDGLTAALPGNHPGQRPGQQHLPEEGGPEREQHG